MRRVGDDHNVKNRKNPAFIQNAFSRQQERVHERPCQSPDHEEADQRRSGRGASIPRVGADDASPISQPGEDGHDSRNTEPEQRSQHEAGHDLAFGRWIEFLHERDVYEIEKVQQADPGDAGDEVDPAQQHEEICLEICGKRNIGREQCHRSEPSGWNLCRGNSTGKEWMVASG